MPRAGFCSCWGRRVLPLLMAYVCYLLLGATIFQLLEKQAETQSKDQFQFEKLRFLENYTCLDPRALEQFVQVTGRAGAGWWAEWGFSWQVQSHHSGLMPCLKAVCGGTESQVRLHAGFWLQVYN